MKSRILVFYSLSLILLIFVFSITAQAIQYKEVKAEEILKQIEDGKEVNYTDCRIVGELNISKIKLKTNIHPYYYELLNKKYSKRELITYGLNEKSNFIDSNITIKNSVFENNVNFSNTYFNKYVCFEDTTFENANFACASFNNSVSFYKANFTNYTNFMNVDFNSSADFGEATFVNFANFRRAKFGNYVSSASSTTVYHYSLFDFHFGEIKRSATFNNANFGRYTVFSEVDFGDYANFYRTDFGKSCNFDTAVFGDIAKFWNAKFANVYFWGVVFGKYVSFSDAKVENIAFFHYANFTNTVGFDAPENSENIYTDGKTCEIFREYYRSEARYVDADNIYYNYREYSQEEKSLLSFSKWIDIFSWVTCGYGLRPSYSLYFGIFVVLLFSVIYTKGPRISLTKIGLTQLTALQSNSEFFKFSF